MIAEQIANSNIHYRYYTWEFFLKQQKSMGVEKIDLFGADPHVWIDCYGISSKGKELRIAAENHGLKIQTFTPEFTSLRYALGREGEAQRKSWDYVKANFEFAKIIEVPRMILSINGFLLDRSFEERWERTRAILYRLNQLAIEYKVDVLITNNYADETNMVRTLDDVKKCLKLIMGGRIYLAMDTASVFMASETPEEWFRVLGNLIVHVNLSNTKFDGMNHCWGDGYLNLRDIIFTLNQNHYKGSLGTQYMVREYLSQPWEADFKTRKMLKEICTQ